MLIIEHLYAGYGQSLVLRDVTLQVAGGEMVAVLGHNGSGRSTLARAIMGEVVAQGRLDWRGQSILGKSSFEIARLGIGYVPEHRDVFPNLTVRQNLILGQKPGGKPGRWTVAAMFELFPPLRQRADVRAGVLSGGEQQMLALCRTLMGDPALIVVDEPTEGLAPQWVETVATFLKTLQHLGTAVLLIEQKLALTLRVAERCILMGQGRVVFDGPSSELEQNHALRKEWLEL